MDYGTSKCVAKRIKVYGMVQGVGFRPLVYHIAQKHHITGSVRNVGGYVEIMLWATEETIELFLKELLLQQDTGCEIVKLETEDIDAEKIDTENIDTEKIDIEKIDIEKVDTEKIDTEKVDTEKIEAEDIEAKDIETEVIEIGDQKLRSAGYQEFRIIDSSTSDEVSILPPDLPVCEACIQELYDKTDRRYKNPLISCTHCGPRYTIIEKLPYDRENTSMVDFELCDACKEEYDSPVSRRHHAQTISCNDCGPWLIFKKPKEAEDKVLNQEALEEAVSILKKGGILAVKGIGGYHFVCSPFLEEAVCNLRKLKGREEKPFAVMFHNIAALKEYSTVSEEEKRLLLTKARPITLLMMHQNTFAPSVNQGSIYCGAFLPYTPLQCLLTEQCGPLIMTSGNLSGQPIIREEKKMFSLESPLLDGVLYHPRRIVRSVDDSVARIIDHKPQLIRRSRGYVPYPVFLTHPASEHDTTIFAAGGDLKAAYCLYQKHAAVVSQYFGDLEEESILKEYQYSLSELSSLFKIAPKLAVCDLHPNYFSSRFAESLGLPLLKVQHHHAHIASVMAEHGLSQKVIGIAFDGTGYGTDGNIWGGEFLLCEDADFRRAAHLHYTPMLGGDAAMRDAKKTAACFLVDSGFDSYPFEERYPIIKAALEHKVNSILSSSMGRLFDAIAALLDIGQENRYEGECASNLEREAVLALREGILPVELSFAIEEKDEIIEINPKPLIRKVVEYSAFLDDTDHTSSRKGLALGFHYAVADMMVCVCRMLRSREECSVVAISGGVFQNSVLMERALMLLRKDGFVVYYNLAVPPNDGGISLGQTYLGLLRLEGSCAILDAAKR